MSKRLFLFLLLSLGILLGWSYLRIWLTPRPPPKEGPLPHEFVESVGAEAAALANRLKGEAQRRTEAMILDAYQFWERVAGPRLLDHVRGELRRSRDARVDKRPIILGDRTDSNLYVEIDRRHATIRSITLNRFAGLDPRYARPEYDEAGKPKPRLLLSDQDGGGYDQLSADAQRDRQSFDLFLKKGDDVWPVVWDPVVTENGNRVAFTGTLAPGVRVVKTFTLQPDQYHVGLELRFERTDAAAPTFVYELTGPKGIIPEGMHWSAQSFRHAVFGTVVTNDKREHRDFRRWLIEPRTLRKGDAPPTPQLNVDPDPHVLQYAGVMLAHFSALVVVDGDPAQLRAIQSVAVEYLGDDDIDYYWQDRGGKIGVRLASAPVVLADDQPVVHKYQLYAGPSKIMLLNYEKNVAEGLVAQYERYRLDRLTDSPSDWWLPRFFWNIGWTKLIIWFTNLMHVVLEWLHGLVGHYGIAIILLTIIVRSLLLPISRKQTQISIRMQEKMAALAPERQKIREKFKDSPAERQRAEMELFKKHGINPLGGCAGCLILLLQMPIFMGLYFALQESVHLRQAGFLWIDNLAAPDMLFKWGDWPVFSWLATGWLRLGDYFNLLPIVSIALMLLLQKVMTPQAMTPEQESQMRMMKFMMIFMAYLFYWLYSGLCLYFIVSTLWGVLERKLMPKISTAKPAAAPAEPGKPIKPAIKSAAKPAADGWRKRLADWWRSLLEEARKKNR